MRHNAKNCVYIASDNVVVFTTVALYRTETFGILVTKVAVSPISSVDPAYCFRKHILQQCVVCFFNNNFRGGVFQGIKRTEKQTKKGNSLNYMVIDTNMMHFGGVQNSICGPILFLINVGNLEESVPGDL